MGKSVYAEDNLLPYLIHLAKPDSYVIGLILGQNTDHRDYVVHLARTPRPASKDVRDETMGEGAAHPPSSTEHHHKQMKSVQDIPESWVADHAKHVTRMLPGGMWVLGIFLVGPGNVFGDNKTVSRLRGVVNHIHRSLSNNPFLHGNSPSMQKLVLHLCSTTRRYICKSFDTDAQSLGGGGASYSVDWKFQSKSTRWHQLDCQYDLDQVFPTSLSKQTQSLKKHLQDILTTVNNSVKSAICMIDGELRDSSELLDALGKKKKLRSDNKSTEDDRILNVSLFIPYDSKMKGHEEMQLIECSGEMNFLGSLASRVFLHQKATVREAVEAVKQDIVRSLASRLELHWDSLIEEEQGCPEERLTLHEPPRRVLVSLPCCRITLSDYLFPGEGPSEALNSLQELLDLKVQESDVQKDLEVQADPTEFYALDTPLEGESAEDLLPVTTNTQNMLIIGLAVAAVALAVTVALQFTTFTETKK